MYEIEKGDKPKLPQSEENLKFGMPVLFLTYDSLENKGILD